MSIVVTALLLLCSVCSVWPLSAGSCRGAPRGFALGAQYVTVVVVIRPSSRTFLCFHSLKECRKDQKTFKSSREMLKPKAQSSSWLLNMKYCDVNDLVIRGPGPPGVPVTAEQLSRAVVVMQKASELWGAGFGGRLGRDTTKHAGLFAKYYCKLIRLFPDTLTWVARRCAALVLVCGTVCWGFVLSWGGCCCPQLVTCTRAFLSDPESALSSSTAIDMIPWYCKWLVIFIWYQ